jgi:hypothetical protein
MAKTKRNKSARHKAKRVLKKKRMLKAKKRK